MSCFKLRLAGEGRSHATIPVTANIDNNDLKKKTAEVMQMQTAKAGQKERDMSGSGPQLVQTACKAAVFS